MNTKFVLLRHGRSSWNTFNKFTGWRDVPLCDTGIKESYIAGKLLQKLDMNFEYAFSSNLIRTTHTLSYIEKYVPIKNVIYNNAIQERNYGDLTGKNKDQILDEYGSIKLHKWRRSYYGRPPNGESLDDVLKRSKLYFDNEILPLIHNNNNVLVVSHGNTIRALFVHLGIYNTTNIELCEIPTGRPFIVDIKNKHFELLF
jgi:2,3-bisphosphoglycerate-dependent phosphoglycerate mutase